MQDPEMPIPMKYASSPSLHGHAGTSASHSPTDATVYRPDIDGLRAIAVLPVLLFHFHIKLFSGGFVGVDIFFVISGYLITQIIYGDLKRDRFSLVTFYERRIRRIFPALFVVLAVTTLVAFIVLLPPEVEDYGKSLMAATVSFSNIYFWSQSGYFDAPASLKPLLHTWSLGVEEQFYLLFPLLLAWTYRSHRRYIPHALIALAVSSFCAAAYVMRSNPSSAFYLPHLRAWELMIGAMIAVGMTPALVKTWQRELAAATGLALIAYAIFTYTAATPFPGFSALVPCIGAALVLAAGRDGTSFAGRVLSLKPFVWIGMISYSLYLWHWPVIVFQNTNAMFVNGLSARVTKLILLSLCIALAWLSWRFVEAPFRAGPRKPSRSFIFKAALVGTMAIMSLGAISVVLDGLPSRFKPEALEVANYLQYKGTSPNPAKCFIQSRDRYEDFDQAACLKISPDKPNYLLLGDSHANHLWLGLTSELDVNIMQASASLCTPTIDQRIDAAPGCSRLMKYVFEDFLPKHHVDKLVIAGYWKEADIQALERTLQWAKQHQIEVLLFGPIVVYDSPLPRILASSIQQGDPSTVAPHRLDNVEKIDADMQAMAAREQTQYVSLYRQICPDKKCRVFAQQNVPLQYDYGHLTEEGSRLLIGELKREGVFNAASKN